MLSAGVCHLFGFFLRLVFGLLYDLFCTNYLSVFLAKSHGEVNEKSKGTLHDAY